MISKMAYYTGRWGGESEILLEELRRRKCFIKGFGDPNKEETFNASPYWYGTVMDYVRLKEAMPLIKRERLARITEDYKNNEVSPIVRCLGLTLERELSK